MWDLWLDALIERERSWCLCGGSEKMSFCGLVWEWWNLLIMAVIWHFSPLFEQGNLCQVPSCVPSKVCKWWWTDYLDLKPVLNLLTEPKEGYPLLPLFDSVLSFLKISTSDLLVSQDEIEMVLFFFESLTCCFSILINPYFHWGQLAL